MELLFLLFSFQWIRLSTNHHSNYRASLEEIKSIEQEVLLILIIHMLQFLNLIMML